MARPHAKKKENVDAAADRRKGIIRVAASLFRERGYSGTTVRDIAIELGLTSGALFHHFGTKEEILLGVAETGLEDCGRLIDDVQRSAKTPPDRLLGMINAHLTALLEGSPETKSVMFYEWWSLSDEALKKVVELRDRYERLWNEAISDVLSKQTTAKDRRLRRLLLIGAMNWTTQWYRPDGSMSVRQIAGELMNIYFPDA